MRYRFSKTALQAGESAFAALSDAEIIANPLDSATTVFNAVIQSMDSYLASIATDRRIKKWPDLTDLTGVPFHVLVRRAGRDLVQTWTLTDARAMPNEFIAQLVDAVLLAQAARETPGKTRWANYPEP